MQALGPAPPPGWQGPSEHLPLNEAAVLRGHEGPVLVVRFNPKGTYCLSGGKVRARRTGSAWPAQPATPPLDPAG